MGPPSEGQLALTERFRAARGVLEKLSDALLTTAALFSLFNSRRDYGQALLCYYLVHSCLEHCLQQCKTNPSVEKLAGVLKLAQRTEAFKCDLRYFLGPTWQEAIPAPPPAGVQAYQQHLAQLASTHPELLLAHAYTLHMALLAGGETIGMLVQKGFSLAPGKGMAVFEFQGGAAQVRERYRRELDGLAAGLNELAVLQMIHEHKQAFRLSDVIARGFIAQRYLVPLRVALRLVPASSWVALAGLVAALGLAVGLRLRTWWE